MSQMEARSRQIQAITGMIGAVTWLLIGGMIGESGIAYLAAAAEGFLFFYMLLAGRLPVCLGRLIRLRSSRGQYKNARKIRRSVLLFQGAAAMAGGCLLFFLAPVIAGEIFRVPFGTLTLRILAPVLVLRVFINILLGFFQGDGMGVPGAAVTVLRSLLYLGFSFLFVKMFRGYGEEVSLLLLNPQLPSMFGAAGMAVAAAVSEVLLLLFVCLLYFGNLGRRRRVGEGLKQTETFGDALGALYRAMGPWMAADILGRIPVWLGMIFFFAGVTDMQTALTEYGGFYGRYAMLCSIPAAVACAVMSFSPVRTAKALRRNEHVYARELFGTGIHACLTYTLFPAVFVAVSAALLGRMAGGQAAQTVEKMLLFGSLVIVLLVLVWFVLSVLFYIGRTVLALGLLVLYAVFYIVAAIVVFRGLKAGAMGLVFSSLAALLLFAVCACLFAFRIFRARFDFLRWVLIPVVGAALSGGLCFLTVKFASPYLGDIFTLVLSLLIGILIYFGFLVLCRNFDKKELESFPGGRILEGLDGLFGRKVRK